MSYSSGTSYCNHHESTFRMIMTIDINLGIDILFEK